MYHHQAWVGALVDHGAIIHTAELAENQEALTAEFAGSWLRLEEVEALVPRLQEEREALERLLAAAREQVGFGV